jgi:hypothetical protein
MYKSCVRSIRRKRLADINRDHPVGHCRSRQQVDHPSCCVDVRFAPDSGPNADIPRGPGQNWSATDLHLLG